MLGFKSESVSAGPAITTNLQSFIMGIPTGIGSAAITPIGMDINAGFPAIMFTNNNPKSDTSHHGDRGVL